MKLMEVFERIGLVEIDQPHSSSTEKDNRSPSVPEAGKPAHDEADLAERRIVSAPESLGIEENRPFEEIYAAAGIPESPFSADKLLKLLDALGSLPEQTRKQAVIAMDAAEESWTMEDPLLDARRRIQALEQESRRLGEWAEHEAELQAQREYEQQAIAQIRKQIADLEALMDRELKKVAETCEQIKAQSRAAREACRREQARLDKEISRLLEIEKLFLADAASSPSNGNNQSGA